MSFCTLGQGKGIIFTQKIRESRGIVFIQNYREPCQSCIFFISGDRKRVGRVLGEKYYPLPIPKGVEILLMVQFQITDEIRTYMEHLKEIFTRNFTSDFLEGH